MFFNDRRANKRALKAAKTPPETRKAQAQVEAGQAQQNLFRVGLVRKLSDELSNKQSTHDLTAMLRLPAARKLLTEILGKPAGNAGICLGNRFPVEKLGRFESEWYSIVSFVLLLDFVIDDPSSY